MSESTKSPNDPVVEKRLDQWYTQSKIGLFLHWGMGTAPGFKTSEEFEAAVNDGGWKAEKWVNEAKKIHAKYITLATFHTCLGHLRPWLSDIPGTARAKRDYLGELIRAAHKEDIKVVVYFTTVADKEGNDVEGYLSYARKHNPGLTEEQIQSSFNMLNTLGFGAYTFDLAKELCKNYDVDGLWFDSYNNPTWYAADAYPWADGFAYEKETKFDAPTFASRYFYKRDINKLMHELKPNLITFVNYFPPIIQADVRGHEFGDKENWKVCPITGPLPMGEENLLIPSGNWWFDGNCPPFDNKREIKRTVHTIACGYVACVSEGPHPNGDFPQPLGEYNVFLSNFLDWAGESLLGKTIPGGRGQGGFAPGEWNDGAYGVTMLLPGTSTHYLHVLAAPSGKALSISDSGYQVTSVKNLKTGEELPFTQANGKVSMEIRDWKPLDVDGDYIIKIKVK